MERIHAAVFPFTGSGHINPMLELSKRLVPLGFSVSFLLTQNDYVKFNQAKEDHIQIVCIPNPHGTSLVFPELEKPVASVLKALVPPVKCIISDFFLGWSQDLADGMGVPRIAFATSSATADMLTYNVPLLISSGYIPVTEANANTLITLLPGIEPIYPTQLPLAFQSENETANVLVKELQRMKEALCVLVNAVEELEQDVVTARRSEIRHYLPIGPLISKPLASLQVEGDDCIKWLDEKIPRSVLYVAFGSQHIFPVDIVETIAQALKLGGKPFVWAMRRNFARGAPEGFYERIRTMFGEQGMVVEWAPQAHILKHSSVGAFFTHCGWNSTLEALCSGMPTLCWPGGGEQNVNSCVMVESWKVGLKVAEGDDDRVTKEEISTKIKIMMEEKGVEMRARAEKFKCVVETGSCSEKNLQRFKEVIQST